MDKIRDRFLWFLAQDLMDLDIVPFGKLVIEIIVEKPEGIILTNIYVQASGFSSQDRVLDGSHRNNHRLGYDQVQSLYLAQSPFFTFFRAIEKFLFPEFFKLELLQEQFIVLLVHLGICVDNLQYKVGQFPLESIVIRANSQIVMKLTTTEDLLGKENFFDSLKILSTEIGYPSLGLTSLEVLLDKKKNIIRT
jgi:hypothetical protein